MKESEYTLKVNKSLLYEFLLCEEEEMGNIHIDEVYKVIDIVIHKYHSSYTNLKSELRGAIFSVILERRSGFNVDKDAYNYIYTQARNEAGNCIYRWTKESKIEDTLNYKEPGSLDDEDILSLDIPQACLKYIHYLTGESDYTIKRISKKDVPDILIYLRVAENKKVTEIPEFVKNNKNSAGILYKLIKEIL